MSKAQVTAIILVCVCSVWFVWTSRIPPVGADEKIIDRFTAIPLRVGQWSSSDVTSRVEGSGGLPTASVLDRVYTNRGGDEVFLTIVYGTSLGDMHQPEYCLGGAGWTTSEQSKVSLRPERKKPFSVMLGSMGNESQAQQRVTLYWFDSAVGKSTLLPWHKMKIYWSRLCGRRVKGVALVRIMVPIDGDEEHAKRMAIDFASHISPSIDTLMARPPKTVQLPP